MPRSPVPGKSLAPGWSVRRLPHNDLAHVVITSADKQSARTSIATTAIQHPQSPQRPRRPVCGTLQSYTLSCSFCKPFPLQDSVLEPGESLPPAAVPDPLFVGPGASEKGSRLDAASQTDLSSVYILVFAPIPVHNLRAIASESVRRRFSSAKQDGKAGCYRQLPSSPGVGEARG